MCGVESCGNWCVSWFYGLPLDGKHGRSNGEWAGNMGLSFWTEKRGNDKNDDDDEMMTRTRMWSFWAEVADFCMPTVQTSNGQGKEGATYGFWLLGQAKIGAKMSGPHIPIFKFFIEILMKNWITIRAKIEGVQKKLFSNNGKNQFNVFVGLPICNCKKIHGCDHVSSGKANWNELLLFHLFASADCTLWMAL